MDYHDIIPAYTGVIVHSNVEGTVFLEYVKDDETLPYNNESYPSSLYKGTYANYLKPINGELHIDNVEIVNGKKTYRNYFFNKGTTAANRPGPDWKDEYITEGWGFFRATSKDYRVFNKAFLHLPANMTESSSEHIEDSGTLPQDEATAQSKESFGMYIMNGNEMKLECTCETLNVREFSIAKQDNNFYTIQGVKIETPQKGIYIRNGKKIIIK